MSVAAAVAVELRCHSCSKFVGVTQTQMRCVCLFKASLMPRVPRGNALEIRKRCTSCGWVNVFHPARLGMHTDRIELK